MTGTEAVDILSAEGHARLLCTNPQQIGIIYVDALDTDLLDVRWVYVNIPGLHTLHDVGVEVHLQQTQLVASYPDVA